MVAAEEHFLANAVPKAAFGKLTPAAAKAAATVPVYFHVISRDSSLSGGNVPYVLFHEINQDCSINLTLLMLIVIRKSLARSLSSTRTTVHPA